MNCNVRIIIDFNKKKFLVKVVYDAEHNVLT